MAHARHQVSWNTAAGVLLAREPARSEIAQQAPALAAHYNEPYNSLMMAHTAPLSPLEVEQVYEQLTAAGGRAFLLYLDGELMGDADFRHIEGGRAEFAILVGARAAQGKGLGTRYAAMLHAWAFEVLRLSTVYVTIIPRNAPSRRLFEKLGYRADSSAQAKGYAEAPDDLCMSVEHGAFTQAAERQGFSLGELALQLTAPGS
jgi:RimJ/RimL family protein N-acetyltransferase